MGDFNTNLGRKAQVFCRFKQILGFMHSITIAYANYFKKESEMKTKKSNFILTTFIPDDRIFISIETKAFVHGSFSCKLRGGTGKRLNMQ